MLTILLLTANWRGAEIEQGRSTVFCSFTLASFLLRHRDYCQ